MNSQEFSSRPHPPPHLNHPTLTTVIAKYIGLILIVGMAAYAILQYMIMQPDQNAMRLVMEHLGHVAFLMVLMYFTLYLVLLKVVITPIQNFQEKLYAVSGGDLTPIMRTYPIREIQSMSGGINLMIERLIVEMPDTSTTEFLQHATILRDITREADALNPSQQEALLDTAAALERHVQSSAKHVIDENDKKARARVE